MAANTSDCVILLVSAVFLVFLFLLRDRYRIDTMAPKEDKDEEFDLEKLLTLQYSRIEKMKRNQEKFHTDTALNRTKLNRLNTRLASYEKEAEEFQVTHRVLTLNTSKTEQSKWEYFTKFHVDAFENEYLNAVGEVLEAKDKVQPPTNDTNSANSSLLGHDNDAQMNVNLPKQTIPIFKGNYAEWKGFEEFFINVIQKQRQLADVQKLIYLKGALEGEPLQLISHLGLNDANYAEAMKMLKDRYTNKRAIFAHALKRFSSQPNVNKESAIELKKLLDITKECIQSMNSADFDTDACGPIIIFFVLQKLPADTRAFWEQQLADSTDLPTFNDFVRCMEIRIRALDAMSGAKSTQSPNNSTANSSSNNQSNSAKRFKTHHASSQSPTDKSNKHYQKHVSKPNNNNNYNNNKSQCPLCSESHPIRLCNQFLAMATGEREATINRLRYCTNCLAFNHNENNCRSNRNCLQCGARHHTLLHPAHRNASSSHALPTTSNTSINRNSNHVSFSALSSCRNVLLATALIQLQSTDGSWHTARALVDQGSEVTLISESIVQLLQLKKQFVQSTVNGVGSNSAASKSVVSSTLKPHQSHNQFKLSFSAVVLKDLTEILPSNQVKIDHWPHIFDLDLADPKFNKPGNIDIILGIDVYTEIICNDLRRGPNGTPIAQQTRLGYIISGVCQRNSASSTINRTITACHLTSLNDTMQQFFAIEEVNDKDPASKEDKFANNFFGKTYKRDESGRFVLKLPFRTPIDPTAVLGQSKQNALNQFLHLERMFSNHPERKSEYVKCINEYIQQNQMQIATNTERDCMQTGKNGISSYSSFYLPHHAVVKESSTSTKLRVVFNASKKSTNGRSLNDVLLTGPLLLADLVSILLNWRCHPFVFVADIQKMYRQIRIDEEDISYQRILWRNNTSEPIQEYCLNRLTFGTNFAPFAAIRTLHELAKLEANRSPNASDIIRNDMYMDDVLSGGSTIENTLEKQDSVKNVLASAGLELTKFGSNTKEILEAIPVEDREVHNIDHDLSFSTDETIKTLGVYWNAAADCFMFKVNIDATTEKFTKRSTLSSIAKLFDPIGVVAPVLTTAKIIMKKIWSLQSDWDSQISADLKSEWKQYVNDLQKLPSLKVARWVSVSPNDISYELHGFSDASTLAYGAVVYLRVIDQYNEVKTHLIMAKSKIAPTKPMTIPRLELCGALLLSKMMNYVKQCIRHINFDTTDIKFFTDSAIVLHWLQNDPNRWTIFVANRVCTILETSTIEQWHHVRTHQNPADLISRGSTPNELASSSLWWHGPSWLTESQEAWPISTDIEIDPTQTEEKKSYVVNTITVSRNDYLKQFSTFRRLIQSTAWFFRFFQFMRNRKNTPTGPLTVIELQSATNFWVKSIQQEHFHEEISSIVDNQNKKVKHRLLQLNPFVDQHGIFRVGGRLEHSHLPYDQKHPIILPTNHHFTDLVIDSAHLQTLHGGPKMTLAHVNRKFWILNGHNKVKFRIHRCIKCFRFKKHCANQLMANLPAPRVRMSKPFSHVGVDFCGPFFTRASKGRGIKKHKSYVSVFVCFATKAIHLELVDELTSEAFIAALRRFIGRRGKPNTIYSDNGTNFCGASKLLKKMYAEYDVFMSESVVKSLANEEIQWKFNPPSAPHFGGLFEAGVKSVKHHLKRVLSETSLTFVDFYTVLCQIEACLNSRPLTSQTSDPNDFSVITPGHFLTTDSLLSIPESFSEQEKVLPTERVRYMQKLVQMFWKQWSIEYLNTLQNRPKWLVKTENIKENDLVLIKDERLPPTKWALARVVQVQPGKDNLVRRATVKTATGLFDRPIVKLCVLPIETNT